jgi:PAS domain S-box-containing protein
MHDPVTGDRPSERPGPASIPDTSPEAWLAAIVASSDDAIVSKTLDSIIQSWNAGATRIFQYEAHEIVGRSIRILIPPELQHEEDEILARLARGERVEHFETVRVRRDGIRLDVSISVSPIRDKFGRIVGAAKIARDITEQKRLLEAERLLAEQLQETAAELEQQVEEAQALQEELEEANDELSRLLAGAEDLQRATEAARTQAEEANAAKGQFLATMSHELRTPLNAIAGYIDLLEMEIRGPVTPEQRQDLMRIKRSQQTLLRLIDDVLSFAKLEAGRLEYRYEAVNLDEFLRTLEAFIAPRLHEKGLTYSLDDGQADVVVELDRAKVEQILLNLLSNAVKFTDAGAIRLRGFVDGDFVHIDVSDTGRGIPPEQIETIFEPFVQGERAFTRRTEGTGLGLSISRQLARAMGGDVSVESKLREGSTFTLDLPRRKAGD